MIYGAVSVNGTAGPYFITFGIPTIGQKYVGLLQKKLELPMRLETCETPMRDWTACHRSQMVSAFLNKREAYQNQRRLNTDIKELHTNLQAHARNAKDWINLVDEFTKSMKQLGDVEHWAKKMERDALILDGCLRLALTNSPYFEVTVPR
ncbi:unnamed protein product [Dicrocoelium dendriticum]|nr:unnamed protein product [Dicrocoelium dendriticum]